MADASDAFHIPTSFSMVEAVLRGPVGTVEIANLTIVFAALFLPSGVCSLLTADSLPRRKTIAAFWMLRREPLICSFSSKVILNCAICRSAWTL